MLVGLVALLVCLAGAATARAEDYLRLKGGSPTNGIEYEHVASNGVGICVTGSYYTASDVTFRMVGAGIKKYLGDHRVFYVAAYPQFSYTTVNADDFRREILEDFGGIPIHTLDTRFNGTADAGLFMLHGGLGWCGVRGWFSFGVELGVGTAFPTKLDIEGVMTQYEFVFAGEQTTESVPYTWKNWKILKGGAVVPMAHLYVGVRL